ncbi:hypothetical protein [Candidatus Symbiopectobacterium sp. NZEC151]|uniref:hypothetical protein n=1 Tax=Candidatus Symbiopectobacterium sp. NZEC151 TaxID=2820470 RepID=UPI0022276FD2|nr:hypothetical protein [Candidatus Symbiopectobacterium sp. NZEC151]MCW2473084.1 hypothetical protein [Candidatus Symbiopectobacterium sp. NZEC151]
MKIKQGMCGLLLMLPLCGFAQTANSDVIEGFTTQQIADALPKSVDGLQRRSVEVVSDYHTFQVEYVDPATMRKVLVTLYTLPADAKGNIPVASSDRDLDAVVASAEKEMLRQRIKPEMKDLTVPGAPRFRCLQTVMNEKVVHQVCSTLFKGRVLEIQPVTMVNDKAYAPAMQRGEELVVTLGKIMSDAVK